MSKQQKKSCRRHKLDLSAFQTALERYVDENKPDPLVKRQIEKWCFTWSDEEEGGSQLELGHDTAVSFESTEQVKGTLNWMSDYMVAQVHVLCCWKNREESIGQPLADGSLYFSLTTSVRFRSKHEKPPDDENGDDSNAKSKYERKAEEKIRAKMIKRLRDDSYINRLLVKETQQKPLLLCEALVKVQTTEAADSLMEPAPRQNLEERVDVVDNIAEGLRRAVFSSAESSLDVMELLLSLPLLPAKSHSSTTNFVCPLADRAKLRLLEDAMFDACEREGEDELIDELRISPSPIDPLQPGHKSNEHGNTKTGHKNPNKKSKCSKR